MALRLGPAPLSLERRDGGVAISQLRCRLQRPAVLTRQAVAVRAQAGNLGARAAASAVEVSRADAGDHGSSTAAQRKPLNVRIDDVWYDLSGWRAAHPAGTHWIDMYDGRDATEVMYAFHSDFAKNMIPRLPKAKVAPTDAAAVTPLTRAFRKLREQLVAEGWFERDYVKEAGYLLGWAACVASAALMLHASANAWVRALAFLPLGLSFCTAGWLAHDYIHGRGGFCTAMRHFGGWGAGFGATMWSDKHNRHHALTNEIGSDEDLSGGPVLWLWPPDPSRDKPWRRFQYLYYPLAFSLLHVVWRVDSIIVAARRRLWPEIFPIVGHYSAFLALFGPVTFLQGVLFGGMVMAFVVTSSHQSEDLFAEHEPDWVSAQFRTTRDAEPGNPFSDWLWGGMQHQLEHHLFPTMPRYKYPALIPVMKRFAGEHGLEYRSESDWEILWRTRETYKRVSLSPAVVGAPATRKGTTI